MARSVEGMTEPEVAGCLAAAAVAAGVTTKAEAFAHARREFGDFGVSLFGVAFHRGDPDLILCPVEDSSA